MRDSFRTVGRYEILGELGRGGMAVVHLARQTELDRHVALKELRALRAGDARLMERFVREARLAGSLSHPNIVTVHDFFVHDGVPYIAMELVECGSLRAHLGETRLPQPQLLGVLEGMLAGLGYAADQGLVHRDVKPENVLVAADGRVKIADFGIARARDQLWQSALTEPGLALGTPAYMAPEQLAAGDVGPRADLYAAGAVAYEMVTGRPPFADRPAPAAALMRLAATTVPSPREAAPDLDAQIAQWIEWLLAADPATRPADAATAWDVLEQHAIRLYGPRWRSQAPLLDAASTRAVSLLASPPATSAAQTPPASATSTRQDPIDVPTPSTPPDPNGADAAPRANAGRHLPRRAPALLAAICAALVAAAGVVSGHAVRADEPGTASASRAIRSTAFQLQVPDGWRRAEVAPSVPGVSLAQPLAARPDQPAGAHLVTGFADAEGPALLTVDKRQVAVSDRKTEAVRLGTLQALRHRELTITGQPATRLTLYAIPSDRGVATVACIAAPPAGALELAACERVASTLKLRVADALALGPSAAYARSVRTILGRLDQRRRRDGRALATAATTRGQAATADRVARGYTLAARALDAVRARAADRPVDRALRAALRRTARAFGALSAAARAGSARRYRSAARAVAGAQRSLDRAVRRLRSAGYIVGAR